MSLELKGISASPTSRFLDQGGQAIIEYILLIVVAIILATALTVKVYKPLQQFLTSYMGDYTNCLLDAGELPSFGTVGSSGTGQCDDLFQSFTFANGKPAKDNANSAGQNNLSSSGNANKNNANQIRNPRDNSIGNSSNGGRNSTALDIANTNGKQTDAGKESSDEGGFVKGGGRARQRGSYDAKKKITSINFSTLVAEEKLKIEKRAKKITKAAEVDEDDSTLKQKIFKVKTPERKIAQEPDEPWSFGRLFRLGFVLILIILIVIVVGGQILQISKNMDANE